MSELISKNVVLHMAWLSRIFLTEEQVEAMTKQLNEILAYFRKLDIVDTSNVPLELYVTPLKNVVRDDVVGESLDPEDALKNAPNREGKFFKAPKMM
ncbi:MAG: Asp-tRNA(Asn)/Glu-tRNA(Gln) amidotransferase subunit GatC [Candidatus Odinarchaeota archaeon]